MSMTGIKQQIELYVEIRYKTDRAVLLSDGVVEGWIPLSQLNEDSYAEIEDGEIGDGLEISIPEWLAKDKGFI